MRGKKTHKGRPRQFAPQPNMEDVSKASDESDETKSSSGSGDEDQETRETKSKGVAHLIETQNPNRLPGAKPITDESAPMSRKEREALELANADPLSLKTEAELARDIARLNLVRKEREEASKLREQERLAREAAKEAALSRAQERLAAIRQKGGKKKGTKHPSKTCDASAPLKERSVPTASSASAKS